MFKNIYIFLNRGLKVICLRQNILISVKTINEFQWFQHMLQCANNVIYITSMRLL